jgi:hypothetical protein
MFESITRFSFSIFNGLSCFKTNFQRLKLAAFASGSPVLLTGAIFAAVFTAGAQTPPNDNFGNAIAITGQTNSVTGNNVGATKEPGEPNPTGNPGGASVWWRWTATTNGTVIVDTIGSLFDTILGIYTGDSVSNLTEVASDDDSGGNATSLVVFSGVAGSCPQRD